MIKLKILMFSVNMISLIGLGLALFLWVKGNQDDAVMIALLCGLISFIAAAVGFISQKVIAAESSKG